MFFLPVMGMVGRGFLGADLTMAGLSVKRPFLGFVAVSAGGHAGAGIEPAVPTDAGVAAVTGKICMCFMTENQVRKAAGLG